MELNLGSIRIPKITEADLELAKTLAKESKDERVQKLCKLVTGLEPKLGRMQTDLEGVIGQLQKSLNRKPAGKKPAK